MGCTSWINPPVVQGGGGGSGLPLATTKTITCSSETGTLPHGQNLVLIDEDGTMTSCVVSPFPSNDWEVDISGGPTDDDWADRTETSIETQTPEYVCATLLNVITVTRSDAKTFTAFSTSIGWVVT